MFKNEVITFAKFLKNIHTQFTNDTTFQIIARWKNYILNNLPADYFNNSISTIKKITAKELQELANKYLQPEDFYELTVV